MCFSLMLSSGVRGGVIVVGNKCEGKAGADGLTEAWRLGLGQAVGVSAEHGEGLGDLYDALVAHAEEMGKSDALMGADEAEEFDASAPYASPLSGVQIWANPLWRITSSAPNVC